MRTSVSVEDAGPRMEAKAGRYRAPSGTIMMNGDYLQGEQTGEVRRELGMSSVTSPKS